MPFTSHVILETHTMNIWIMKESPISIDCQVCMGQEYSGELKGIPSLSLRVYNAKKRETVHI